METFTKKILDSVVSRLKKGTSTLGKESKALDINRNGPLRAALKQHLGSKKAYDELISKAREKRSSSTDTNKKASKAKATKKNSPPGDSSKDSSDDEDSSGEPQDVVEAMSGGQEEERREDVEPNGVADADVDVAQALSLV